MYNASNEGCTMLAMEVNEFRNAGAHFKVLSKTTKRDTVMLWRFTFAWSAGTTRCCRAITHKFCNLKVTAGRRRLHNYGLSQQARHWVLVAFGA